LLARIIATTENLTPVDLELAACQLECLMAHRFGARSQRRRRRAVSDIDIWRLVFDRCTGNLVVRHQWETDRYSGVDDFGIVEFLVEQGAAQSALLTLLFDEATVAA
jgi:hypothetical protein